MGTHTENVKAYYDASVEKEWDRLAKERFEFDINMNFLSRYIKPGDALLDLGGGPGRYALAFAEKGVRVTLCDLSPANAAFALCLLPTVFPPGIVFENQIKIPTERPRSLHIAHDGRACCDARRCFKDLGLSA